MALKPELIEAFAALGISPEVDQATAVKAYKRLALIHHPDRNHGDSTATERFQQIGAAWNICQKHFDNPAWSHVSEPSAAHTHSSDFTYTFSTDDDIPLDEDELRAFYEFMFKETIFGRYSRSKGQRYRYERSGGAGAGVYTFSDGFAGSQARQAKNTERQRKESEDYQKRKRELELEIEEEEKERQKLAKKLQADEDRRATALEHAFQAACAGNSSEVRKSVLDYDLDVNATRRRGRRASGKKPEDVQAYDSLLHLAASHCDESLVMHLIERGARINTLNREQLTPFHAAIKAGNTSVVHFFMNRRGRLFEGYHPSKAAPSGRTPLQLAIDSRVPAMVELLLKDATTHDVERCWKLEYVSEEIKQILRRKKGFVPPEEAIVHNSSPSLSKKSLRQQQLAHKKEARIAEELERAIFNRQKKEERAAKQAATDREQKASQLVQEARRKADVEEYHRLEDKRKKEEAETRARQQQEVQLKTEADLLARAEVESRAKAKIEPRSKVHVESNAKPAIKPHEKSSNLYLLKPDFEAFDSARPEEKLTVRNEDQTLIKEETSLRSAHVSTVENSNIPPGIEIIVPSKIDLAREKKREIRRTKLKAKRNAIQSAKKLERQSISAASLPEQVAPTIQPPPGLVNTESTSTKKPRSSDTVIKGPKIMDEPHPTVSQHEATLRRRTEQSARDKERHRRKVEERAKATSQQEAVAESHQCTPSTPVSTHPTVKSPERSKHYPSSSWLLPPRITPEPSFTIMPTEDFQTCIVPDDLFKDERPYMPTTQISGIAPAPTASPFKNRETSGVVDRLNRRPRKHSRRGRENQPLAVVTG